MLTDVLIVETLWSMLVLALSKVAPNPDVSDFKFSSSVAVSLRDELSSNICLAIPLMSCDKTLVAAEPWEMFPSSNVTIWNTYVPSSAGK